MPVHADARPGATPGPPRRPAPTRRARNALLLAPLLAWIALAARPGHDFQDRCTTCHLSQPPPDAPRDAPLLLRDRIDTLCLSCHPEQKESSHPTAVSPTYPLPKDFPLNLAGELTCTTCHFPHALPDHPESRSNPFLLRRPEAGKPFCTECHAGGFPGIRQRHNQVLAAAHEPKPRFRPAGKGPLDPGSRECIGCHDESYAGGADMNPAGGIWLHASGVSHPIGVEYPTEFPRNRFYRPVEELDPRLRLVDGRIVGCATCHDKFSRHEYYLVMSNKGAKLCLSCHMM